MVSPARWSWVDLPPEVTASILSRLTAVEILISAQFVCKAWLEVSKDPLVWKRIDVVPLIWMRIDLVRRFAVEICRRAVDRSCGQAVEVNIHLAADDDLLDYISDRFSFRSESLGMEVRYLNMVKYEQISTSISDLIDITVIVVKYKSRCL